MSRILLKAPLSPYSGWGQDGVGLAEALLQAGNPPFLLPLEVVPPLPDRVARLLARPLRPPFDLLLAHIAADRCRLAPVERSACRHRVLWSMWEWTTFGNHPDVDRIREDVADYDAVVAYDPVSAGAFAALGPSVPPVLTVQGGFDAAAWPYLARTWRPPVRYLMIGHLTDRKNPVAAADAFTALIDEHGTRQFDAELHVKVVDRANPMLTGGASRLEQDDDGLVAEPSREHLRRLRGRERVTVHVGTWSRSALLKLYGGMHCLLAPSRGEGKNLAALEFMATGGPVIATDVGGHRMWLDESYAYPLRYRLRPASWPVPTTASEDAEADLGHLTELMWRVYTDLGEAADKGRRAATTIPAACDWSAALARLTAALTEIGIIGGLHRRPSERY